MVLVLQDSVPLNLSPRDWVDLFHSRFLERVSFPDPGSSPEAAAFMEAVLLHEAERTGDAEAGFDWLRRLDRAVLAYPEDPADGIGSFLRGQVSILVVEGRLAAELVQRTGVILAPMESGATPFPRPSGEVEGPSGEGVRLPPRWLSTWRAEVRGRS